VGDRVVAAEDATARRLTPLITSQAPLTAPLRAAGVRYVIVDAGWPPGDASPGRTLARRLTGAAVVLAGPHIVVYRLANGG